MAKRQPAAKADVRQTSVTRVCPTLSGSSNLQYVIGADGAGRAALRIVGNSGGGMFSHEWVFCNDIINALEEVSPVTSSALMRVFARKSANTPGFLLAALVKEKLVEALPGKTRHFKLLDPAPFLDRVTKLAKSAKPTAPNPAKKAAAKKSSPKKKAKK